MSGKTVDVDLRIRAKNLSKSTLKEITDDVADLTKAQQEQAKSADLAARSMKELLVEQQRAAALARELSNRKGLLQRYIDERAEIDSLARKLIELAATRKRAAQATDGMADGKSLKVLDKDIVSTENRLKSFTEKVQKTEARLTALGVETADVGKSMAEISEGVQKATAAYDVATKNVAGYSAAVDRANSIQAEAIRRTREEAEARAKLAAANRQAVQKTGNRNVELAALRADIEERSRLARETDIATEAQRRFRVEQEALATSVGRSNRAAVEAIQLLERRRQRQADLNAVFAPQLALMEREEKMQAEQNARRQRLIGLINSERGQRLLSLEAQRQEAAQATRTASAKDKLASSTNRAAREQAFFADTGRKSLSVYQRIRGQILALASAYIGIYQAINTVNDAIAAVNRNQALQIGLLTANSGDARKAASDYAFLRKEADRLGLVFDDVAPKYANMLIAAQAVGVSARETRKLFTDVATSVAAGNLSLDDAEGVFRAVVQVMGKARVQAEELRGQLGDRLPGAVAAFAAANNIALTDLDKHLKEGKGTLQEFLKFMGDYAQKFAPAMGQATDRLQAHINRARNAYNDWLRDMLNSGNQTKLKNAFSKIEEFFAGRKGEEFAESLGKAFSKLVDVFIWLADNIDLVTKALKIFIAVQVTKFALDTAGSIQKLVLQVIALGTASKTSGAEVGKMAGFLRGFKLALVGVAGLVLGVAAALDAQSTALKNTQNDLEDYADLLDRIGTRQGKPKAQTFDEAKKNVEDIQAEIKDTQAQAAKLQGFLGELEGGFIGKVKAGFKGTLGLDGLREVGIGPLTKVQDIQSKINELNKRSLNLRESESEEIKIQSDLLAKELVEAEEEAKKAQTTTDTGETDKERKARERAEKAAQRAREAAERQARAREAAEDAAAKKIISLQDEIEQAKIESSARSTEQIEANFQATLKRIDLDIEKKRLEMQALQRQSEAAGVDNSAKFTTMDGLLGALELSLKARAEEERVTAILELRQRNLNDLVDERNDKIQLQNTLMETGQQGQLATQQNVNAIQEEYNAKIRQVIADFMVFLNTLDPEGELWKRLGLDKVVRDLQQTNVEVAKLNAGQKFLAKWGEQLGQGFSNVFQVLGKGIADALRGFSSWSDAIKGAWDAFRNFAADFLQQIAQMIIQAIILQAIQNAINGTSGGYGGAIKAAFGTAHTGGVVRSGERIGTNPRRRVDPAVFAGAQKFHNGGLPGLKQGEVAAIVKKGEEIVTEDNPRHIANAGQQAGAVNIDMVNTIDPTAVISAGLRSGRKTVVNDMTAMMRTHRNEFKTALGV